MNKKEALMYRSQIVLAAKLQDDSSALESIWMYPEWSDGLSVNAGDRYRYNEILYKCVQQHVTQSGWEPDKTPALWVVVSVEEWPEWVQPTGSQDAYMIGDKVSYNSEHYISSVDNNVWAPDVYGWEKV